MIFASALKHRETGEIFWLPRPARHHHLFEYTHNNTSYHHREFEQGFVNENLEFLNRTEARIIAEECGQLLPDAIKLKILCSEEVW